MKIAYNDDYISESTDENRSSRIHYATKYNILSRKYYQTTIPYFKVTINGITVKRYKNNNPDLLVAGIDTNACFKIFGVDNDFLLYTLFDKNGIVLKITDEEDKLIGRISGFRNGNIVYLHQARTIYDKLPNHSSEVINTIKRMCQAIETFAKNLVEITSKDEHPIEHVVILRGFGYNDDDLLKEVDPKLIELNPMDNISEDWTGFKTIEGVKYRQKTDDFTTGYQTAKSILLLASNKIEGINSYQDINSYDVPSQYLRPREVPKTIIDSNLISIIPILRKIDATYALYFDEEYIPVRKLEDIESITYGEDWYYIVKNNGLTFECFIPLDPRAELELEQCKAFYQNKTRNPEVSSTDKSSSKIR